MKSGVVVETKNGRIDNIEIIGECFNGKIVCLPGNPLDSIPPQIGQKILQHLTEHVVEALCKMVNQTLEVAEAFGINEDKPRQRWGGSSLIADGASSLGELKEKLRKAGFFDEESDDEEEEGKPKPRKDEIIH